jgi:hypothetical protein
MKRQYLLRCMSLVVTLLRHATAPAGMSGTLLGKPREHDRSPKPRMPPRLNDHRLKRADETPVQRGGQFGRGVERTFAHLLEEPGTPVRP